MTEVMETNQTGNKNKAFLFPFIAVLIGSLMLVATIFMPFATATDDYKEYLQEYSDEMYAEELDMTNGDAINISLFEFGKLYAAASEMGMSESIAIACLILIIGYGVLSVLTLLFSVLKKPIAAIIFNLLSFGIFYLTRWDFEDRGVIPSNSYDWGFAQYICYIGVLIVLIGAVALLVVKIKNKKEKKAALIKENTEE